MCQYSKFVYFLLKFNKIAIFEIKFYLSFLLFCNFMGNLNSLIVIILIEWQICLKWEENPCYVLHLLKKNSSFKSLFSSSSFSSFSFNILWNWCLETLLLALLICIFWEVLKWNGARINQLTRFLLLEEVCTFLLHPSSKKGMLFPY